MLHLGYNRSGDTFHPSAASQSVSHRQPDLLQTGSPWAIQASYSPPTPPTNTESQADRRNVVVHWPQAGQSYTSGGKSDDDEESGDTDYRPFTPPPPRERLSYTRYQLELLNGVYKQVKYPNSTQKLLIAKRVGITRDQVKIWFQNRRRKDVLSKQGRKDDSDGKTTPQGSPASVSGECNEENRGEGMVPSVVMDSIISELVKYKNEHLKSKKQKSKKKSTEPPKTKPSMETLADSNARLSGQWGLFSGYDMVSPPNQITPSAFEKLATMSQAPKRAKQPAFERPGEQQIQSRRSSPLSYFNYDCNQPQSRYSNTNIALESYNSHYNPLCEMTSANHRRVDSGFQTNRPNSSQGDIIDNSICREINTNQRPNGSCSILSNINHTDTIPILSDLLEHSQRHPVPEATKSRDSLWCPINNKPTADEHGLSALTLPYPNYPPFDPATHNRVPLPFPFSTEPAVSGSCLRLSDPCRPHPHYPSPFPHHDPYQAFPATSLNNPYYIHHQSSAALGHSWQESPYQEPHFVQL